MSRKIQLKFFILILLLFFGGASSQAKEALEELGAPAPGTPETLERYLIRRNISVAEWFDGVADGMDVFLAGQRYTKKPNETSATLETAAYYNEADGGSAALNFNVDLRLPNVEEYWQLTFTSYDESEERSVKSRYLRQNPRERNYGASVGLFKKLGDVRTSFRPRITFEGTPAISHSLKFDSIADYKTYKFNPKLEFYATPFKGAGVFQALNFHWDLTKVWTLTLINEGDYQSRPHVYTVTNGVSFGQFVRTNMAFSYNLFVTSINRPNYQLEAYNISTTWSHILYKKILDYQIIPNIDFSQKRNFVGNPGITVSVNLNF